MGRRERPARAASPGWRVRGRELPPLRVAGRSAPCLCRAGRGQMSEVVFVGTSDAFGAGGRRQSALVLRAPNGGALLDCGTTTSTGLAALGIQRDEIDCILISHFH